MPYFPLSVKYGILRIVKAERRTQLATVLRTAGELVTVEAAARALAADRLTAAKLLARWASQGWLTRLRRGLYAPVPLAAAPGDQVLEDAWRLVPKLFAPGYIGGATAAQHWDLTEQIFRTIFVYSARSLRSTRPTVSGIPFAVRHVQAVQLFGTNPVWRGSTRVEVSDVHRTVVDMLDDPAMGGGIRHVAGCLKFYLARTDADPAKLIEYAERLGNGAVFKRLGFLVERLGGQKALIDACATRLTKGNAKLDPALPSPRLVTRWRLRMPAKWEAVGDD
jgi:predicted transcriptional regulator of viral defense system